MSCGTLRQRASDQKSDAGSPGGVFSGDVLGSKTDENDLMTRSRKPLRFYRHINTNPVSESRI
jgi:hypothetical protein